MTKEDFIFVQSVNSGGFEADKNKSSVLQNFH